MPVSTERQISAVLQLVFAVHPQALIDVGLGFGAYGFLARMKLDGAHFHERAAWTTRIDGIEGFAPYLSAGQDRYYDAIIVGDARAILPTIPDNRYDLALLVDVLEHFAKDEGGAVLAQLQRIATWVVVATPDYALPQGAAFGNELEIHRSLWSRAELRRAGARLAVPTPGHHVVLLCRAAVAQERRAWLTGQRRRVRREALLQPVRLLPESVTSPVRRFLRTARRLRHPPAT